MPFLVATQGPMLYSSSDNFPLSRPRLLRLIVPEVIAIAEATANHLCTVSHVIKPGSTRL